MKEYLPYFDNLDKKYKDIYMEWSKEELTDHLVANIKNGEILLNRIEKAIEYIGTFDYLDSTYEHNARIVLDNILEILKGEIK